MKRLRVPPVLLAAAVFIAALVTIQNLFGPVVYWLFVGSVMAALAVVYVCAGVREKRRQS